MALKYFFFIVLNIRAMEAVKDYSGALLLTGNIHVKNTTKHLLLIYSSKRIFFA